MKWVTKYKIAELTGLTVKAVEARREKGIWIDGVHWKKVSDGRIWFNTEAIEKWIEAA